VYVSCNPASLADNAALLCAPADCASPLLAPRPFRPVKAMAVDLFPHTNHCEAVMLFEREPQPAAAPAAEAEPDLGFIPQE
jgi:tRNA (uracil-5-)-methyltransferase